MTKSHKHRFSISAVELSTMLDKTAVFELYEPIALPDDIGGKLLALEGEIQFQLRDKFILCHGDLQSKIELICDRCLSAYTWPLHVVIDEAYQVINSQWVWDEEIEISPQDPMEQVRADQAIEISDLLYQHFVLNIPYQKICSENCYNEHLERLNQASATEATADSPWHSVRQAVERWEQDKK